MLAACFLSFGIGFITLSQAMLWVRLFGFVNLSVPQSYIFVSSIFLLGTAVGAFLGGRLGKPGKNPWENSGYILLAASLIDLVAPWFYAYTTHTPWQILFGTCVMVIIASLNAVVLPVAYYLGVSSDGAQVGRSSALVFGLNILGAILGLLVTGHVMLDAMKTQDCIAVCAELTFVLSMFCLREEFQPAMMVVASMFAAMILGFVVVNENTEMMGLAAAANGDIHRVIENHSGVLITYDDGARGDAFYADNIYQGNTSLDPVINAAALKRILVTVVLQNHPQNILLLGLAMGVDLKLITSFPVVENIDIVEMNSGYLEAITDYPQLQAGLIDARAHLHIDSNRRWLRNHPDKKYDLIIVNHAGLLSREFFLMLKQHMQEQAVLTFNSSHSLSILSTAKKVFLHAYPDDNFIIAADFDWREKMHDPAARKKLVELNFDGKPIFPPANEIIIDQYLHYSDQGAELTVETITDRNVLGEFKQAASFFSH